MLVNFLEYSNKNFDLVVPWMASHPFCFHITKTKNYTGNSPVGDMTTWPSQICMIHIPWWFWKGHLTNVACVCTCSPFHSLQYNCSGFKTWNRICLDALNRMIHKFNCQPLVNWRNSQRIYHLFSLFVAWISTKILHYIANAFKRTYQPVDCY